MLKFRAISFTLLLGVLALTIFWSHGKVVFFALAIPVAVMLVLEILRMLKLAGLPGNRAFAVAVVAYTSALPLAAWGALRLLDYRPAVGIMQILWWLVVPGAAVMAWTLILTAKQRLEMLKSLVVAGGAAAFTLALILPVMEIYQAGGMLFLYFILTTKAGDTGGYIVGKLSSLRPGGNHKVVPSISPAKSWEGVGGGLALSIGVSMLFAGCGWMPMTWWWALTLGVVLYGGSFAGDLSESAFKRACGVKDSGNWIPGMGGIFDVLDSFIYNGPIFVGIMMVLLLVERA